MDQNYIYAFFVEKICVVIYNDQFKEDEVINHLKTKWHVNSNRYIDVVGQKDRYTSKLLGNFYFRPALNSSRHFSLENLYFFEVLLDINASIQNGPASLLKIFEVIELPTFAFGMKDNVEIIASILNSVASMKDLKFYVLLDRSRQGCHAMWNFKKVQEEEKELNVNILMRTINNRPFAFILKPFLFVPYAGIMSAS
jgi:hypothetical protein